MVVIRFYYFYYISTRERTTYTDLTVCEGRKVCLELDSYKDGYKMSYYGDEHNTTKKATSLCTESQLWLDIARRSEESILLIWFNYCFGVVVSKICILMACEDSPHNKVHWKGFNFVVNNWRLQIDWYP